MKNVGKNQHRLHDNPLEAEYAAHWENINAVSGTYSLLDYLLAEEINRPVSGEVSDRDREVAATVIQWLGSPIGENFVTQVLKAYGKRGK